MPEINKITTTNNKKSGYTYRITEKVLIKAINDTTCLPTVIKSILIYSVYTYDREQKNKLYTYLCLINSK